MVEQKIKIIKNTELEKYFSALEYKYFEFNSCQSIINFILLHPELKNEYDFYWEKIINIKIGYEKQKIDLLNYLQSQDDKIKDYYCDFYNGIITLYFKEESK